MIRRISIEVQIGLGSSFVPDRDTLAIFAEAVAFTESLDGRAFGADQFWLSCELLLQLQALRQGVELTVVWCNTDSAHVMSSLLSSLIRLSLATTSFQSDPPPFSSSQPDPSPITPVSLLARLRHALHSAHALRAWEVPVWALQRAEKVALQLRQVGGGEDGGEYAAVVHALEGTAAAQVQPVALTLGAAVMPSSVSSESIQSGMGGDSLGMADVEVGGQLADLETWLNVLDVPAGWDEGFGSGMGIGGADWNDW